MYAIGKAFLVLMKRWILLFVLFRSYSSVKCKTTTLSQEELQNCHTQVAKIPYLQTYTPKYEAELPIL
jgi:hypothetical protein